MRTVKSLINELKKFPEDAPCYAYEGEIVGVVIGRPNVGHIECSEVREIEDSPAVIY